MAALRTLEAPRLCSLFNAAGQLIQRKTLGLPTYPLNIVVSYASLLHLVSETHLSVSGETQRGRDAELSQNWAAQHLSFSLPRLSSSSSACYALLSTLSPFVSGHAAIDQGVVTAVQRMLSPSTVGEGVGDRDIHSAVDSALVAASIARIPLSLPVLLSLLSERVTPARVLATVWAAAEEERERVRERRESAREAYYPDARDEDLEDDRPLTLDRNTQQSLYQVVQSLRDVRADSVGWDLGLYSMPPGWLREEYKRQMPETVSEAVQVSHNPGHGTGYSAYRDTQEHTQTDAPTVLLESVCRPVPDSLSAALPIACLRLLALAKCQTPFAASCQLVEKCVLLADPAKTLVALHCLSNSLRGITTSDGCVEAAQVIHSAYAAMPGECGVGVGSVTRTLLIHSSRYQASKRAWVSVPVSCACVVLACPDMSQEVCGPVLRTLRDLSLGRLQNASLTHGPLDGESLLGAFLCSMDAVLPLTQRSAPSVSAVMEGRLGRSGTLQLWYTLLSINHACLTCAQGTPFVKRVQGAIEACTWLCASVCRVLDEVTPDMVECISDLCTIAFPGEGEGGERTPNGSRCLQASAATEALQASLLPVSFGLAWHHAVKGDGEMLSRMLRHAGRVGTSRVEGDDLGVDEVTVFGQSLSVIEYLVGSRRGSMSASLSHSLSASLSPHNEVSTQLDSLSLSDAGPDQCTRLMATLLCAVESLPLPPEYSPPDPACLSQPVSREIAAPAALLLLLRSRVAESTGVSLYTALGASVDAYARESVDDGCTTAGGCWRTFPRSSAHLLRLLSSNHSFATGSATAVCLSICAALPWLPLPPMSPDAVMDSLVYRPPSAPLYRALWLCRDTSTEETRSRDGERVSWDVCVRALEMDTAAVTMAACRVLFLLSLRGGLFSSDALAGVCEAIMQRLEGVQSDSIEYTQLYQALAACLQSLYLQTKRGSLSCSPSRASSILVSLVDTITLTPCRTPLTLCVSAACLVCQILHVTIETSLTNTLKTWLPTPIYLHCPSLLLCCEASFNDQIETVHDVSRAVLGMVTVPGDETDTLRQYLRALLVVYRMDTLTKRRLLPMVAEALMSGGAHTVEGTVQERERDQVVQQEVEMALIHRPDYTTPAEEEGERRPRVVDGERVGEREGETWQSMVHGWVLAESTWLVMAEQAEAEAEAEAEVEAERESQRVSQEKGDVTMTEPAPEAGI
ncbi:hypothetical protein KIPB_000086 [Kipferlia bialata]|uniref:Uncharacterized protein n=1 Tax=Kipferlia bialata TaxID=797122 RepID=A0A9K3CLR5_9EUKA|nr:hypothetical protein KIPB_000086 [Kipferlia bialata]|eukprot:g86.t1